MVLGIMTREERGNPKSYCLSHMNWQEDGWMIPLDGKNVRWICIQESILQKLRHWLFQLHLDASCDGKVDKRFSQNSFTIL